MFPSLQRLVRVCLPVLRIFAYIAPLALVCFYSYYTASPGPFVQYNVFTGLILSICLLFTSSQLVLLDKGVTTYTGSRWRRRLTKFYWSGVAGTSIACGICYAGVKKHDCMAICIFILLVTIFASVRLAELTRQDCERRCVNRRRSGVYQLVNETMSKLKVLQTPQSRIDSFDALRRTPVSSAKTSAQLTEASRWDQEDEIPWWKSANKAWKAATWASRPFRIVHILITIFNVLGAVMLVQRSRYENPGQRMIVVIPTFGKQAVNFYCTTSSVPDPGSKPTVWLEGDATQGIADFQGIQHYLLDHNISSCSYDPPSFGGSDTLPSTARTDSDLQLWMPALLKALKTSPIYVDLNTWQNFTYVGWGGMGLTLAVQHALSDEYSSKIIALDPAPDGVEYFVDQVAHHLTETQRLDLRKGDLARQATEKRNSLALGMTWGLLPFFKEARIPTPAVIWPSSGAATWKLQKQQETFVARQYYDLRRAATSRREDLYLRKTKLRDEMEIHAIINQNDVPGNLSLTDIWRRQRLSVVKSLGGRAVPTTWCWENCTSLWPIEKAKFAADAIARIINKS